MIAGVDNEIAVGLSVMLSPISFFKKRTSGNNNTLEDASGVHRTQKGGNV